MNICIYCTGNFSNNYKGQKPRGGKIYTIVGIVLLLVLLAGSIPLLIIFLPASTAMVTITPRSERITHAYYISLTDGNAATGQIQEHKISYTTPQQSQRVPATGKGHHNATQAHGKVVISQIHLFNSSDHNSYIGASDVPANDGTMITINGFTATEGGSVTVDARAITAGSSGNIPAYDINATYEIVNILPGGSPGSQIGTAYVAREYQVYDRTYPWSDIRYSAFTGFFSLFLRLPMYLSRTGQAPFLLLKRNL